MREEFLRTLGRLAAERVKAAGVDQFAGQLVADDFLGETTDFDQGIKIDTGVDAHFLTEHDQFLGADVARGLRLASERAATEAADS